MKVVFYSLSDEDLFLNRLPVARHLRDAGYEVVCAAPVSEYAERIREEGFAFHRVLGIGRTVIGDMAATASFGGVLSRVKADIVHTFGLRAAVRGGLAARMKRITWVVHSVTLPQSQRDRRPPPMLKTALSEGEVTFRRREDRDMFIGRQYVRPEQTHVLRSSGIDLRDIPLTDEPERTPVAALLSPDESDLEFFGQAAQNLRNEGIDGRFAVIGPAQSSRMRTQLQRWQEEGTVEWWGKREDLVQALSSVHIICLPAMMPARERILASSVGRPLVSAVDPAVDRVLRPGDSAVILRSNDAGHLTESLGDLLQDVEKRRRMGRRAREIVESEYSAKCVAMEIMGVYERLFEKGRPV